MDHLWNRFFCLIFTGLTSLPLPNCSPPISISKFCSFSQSCFLTKLDLHKTINSVWSFFTQPTLPRSFRHWIPGYAYHTVYWGTEQVETASLIEEAYQILCTGYFFLLRRSFTTEVLFFMSKLTHLSLLNFLQPTLNTCPLYLSLFSLFFPLDYRYLSVTALTNSSSKTLKSIPCQN